MLYAILYYVTIIKIKDQVSFPPAKNYLSVYCFGMRERILQTELFVGFALECGFAFFPHRSFLRVDRLSHRHF